MKSLLLGAALATAAILPSIAHAAPTTAESVAAKQSVFTSVSHTIIENADGSETMITVYTSYYVFGVR